MENNQYKYIVYLTMNLVNGKHYVGVHKTETPWKFDGYLGCGAKIDEPSSYNKGKTPLHAAILKYGTKSFKRITLKVFDSYDEALKLEAEIVNKDFIRQPSNYNATVGGGLPPILTRKINQFSLEGVFIKTWESETEICKFYNVKVQLSDIVENKRNFAGSYWTFEEVKKINIDEYKRIVSHSFIDQYDKDGNYITSYKSVNVASQQLDIDFKKLNSAVFKMKLCEGYYFLKSGINIFDVIAKKGKRTANRHPVHRYLSTGEYDKSYETTVQAVRDTPKSSSIAIKNAVVNGYLCGGYHWSYFKSDNYSNIENPKEYTKIPPIEQYDKEENLIKVWDNYKECKKEFPYCLRVCRGDLKSTAGYIFKYKD